MQSKENRHFRYYHYISIEIWEPRGDKRSLKAPRPWTSLQYIFAILSRCKFYYEKAHGGKVNLTIYRLIYEYPMEEIHSFWPKLLNLHGIALDSYVLKK